ncbi:MAG: helix-turn-helix transcriptional regulator [Patescibacteria group bacterium]
MAKDPKTPKQMERHLKGVSNHRRIEILMMIAKNDGIILESIAENLNCNIKTISEHTRRLVYAGLINKKYEGRSVMHALSPYGKTFYRFIETFQHS